MSEPNQIGGSPSGTGTGAPELHVDPRALAELDRACGELAAALIQAQDRAAALGELTTWGLGESDPALRTAHALVNIFREKAAGGPGDAHSALGEYLTETEELRTLLATVATVLPQVDEQFAQRLGQLDS
ncbi:hypothetical protein [Nocardia shimofusensis]|uniref:hypothetical protein n=1 Tax=Nocardia shimofusensis TaxID=228596 RepID=UPI000A6D1843|nr:hypothetical protein [Nocardia shimofusensis]